MTKRYTVVFTPRAERQLDNLYTYIADHSEEARADSFVSGIVADCLSLSTFPERGTKRDDIRPNLRIMGYARRVTIEVANVLLIYERRKQLTAAERTSALGFYSGLPIQTDDQTAARAWSSAFDLALAHKLTVYNAGYLELSLRSGLPLATLDQALCKAAVALGVPVLGYTEETG
jgi:plasmid stabilization system protein ParE